MTSNLLDITIQPKDNREYKQLLTKIGLRNSIAILELNEKIERAILAGYPRITLKEVMDILLPQRKWWQIYSWGQEHRGLRTISPVIGPYMIQHYQNFKYPIPYGIALKIEELVSECIFDSIYVAAHHKAFYVPKNDPVLLGVFFKPITNEVNSLHYIGHWK